MIDREGEPMARPDDDLEAPITVQLTDAAGNPIELTLDQVDELYLAGHPDVPPPNEGATDDHAPIASATTLSPADELALRECFDTCQRLMLDIRTERLQRLQERGLPLTVRERSWMN